MAKNSPFKRADVGLMRGARAAYEEVHYKGELISEPVMKATDKILEDYEKKQLKKEIDQKRLADAIQKNKQATRLTGGWNYGDGQKEFYRFSKASSDKIAELTQKSMDLEAAGLTGSDEYMNIQNQQADIIERAQEVRAQLNVLNTKRDAYLAANDNEDEKKRVLFSSATGGVSLQRGVYLKDYPMRIQDDENGRPKIGFMVKDKFVSYEDIDKDNVPLITGLTNNYKVERKLQRNLGKEEGNTWENDGEPMANQYLDDLTKTPNATISTFYDRYDGNPTPYEKYMAEITDSKTGVLMSLEERKKLGMSYVPLSPEDYGEFGSRDTNTLNWMKERIFDTFKPKLKTQFDKGVDDRTVSEEILLATQQRQKDDATKIHSLLKVQNISLSDINALSLGTKSDPVEIIEVGNDYQVVRNNKEIDRFPKTDRKKLQNTLYRWKGIHSGYWENIDYSKFGPQTSIPLKKGYEFEKGTNVVEW